MLGQIMRRPQVQIANLRTFDTGDPEKMALWNIKTAGIAWWHDYFVGFDKAGARRLEYPYQDVVNHWLDSR